MATPLAYTARYIHPVAVIRVAFAEEQYWKDRIAAVGGPNARFVSLTVGDDHGRVETVQYIPGELLPQAISAVRPGDLVIPRIETWTGGREGTFEARVQDAPAEASGIITAVDEPTGAVATIEGTVTVKIPMFGKRIETVLAERLTELLDAETEFTNNWIAERGIVVS